MPLLLLKDIPQYECLLEAAEHYPTLDPTAHEAFLHLLRTADLLDIQNQSFLARHHVSQSRFTVLMLLHSPWPKEKTPAKLADHANVTRATMTGLIDTLEHDGFAIRRADPKDRRITHIQLTEAGKAKVESMIPECFQRMSRAMQPLDSVERKELVRLLQKLQSNFSSAGESPGEAGAPEPNQRPS